MTDCPICFSEITAATGQTTLGCTHTFHLRCIAQWFKTNVSCPCCRRRGGEHEILADEDAESTTSLTPLMQAAHAGDLLKISQLASMEVDINELDERGCTALAYCIEGGENALLTVTLLLELGANIHIKDIEGMTALGRACREGRWPIVKLLIEHGADVNAPFPAESTALMIACWARTAPTEIVKYLVGRGANINYQSAQLKGTALLWACKANKLSVVLYLLRHGADPHVAEWDNTTPMTLAVNKHGNWKMATLLHEYGLAFTDAHLKTIFEKDVHSIVSLLIREKILKKGDALLAAAAAGAHACVLTLLDLGANVNYRDASWTTPLMKAVMGTKDAHVISSLLKRGADPHATNMEGKTALMMWGAPSWGWSVLLHATKPPSGKRSTSV